MAGPDKKKERKDVSLSRARTINRMIFGVALFGTLLIVHLWIQSERNFSHGCFGFSDPADVGVVECTAVLQSDAGKLFGISNIIWGLDPDVIVIDGVITEAWPLVRPDLRRQFADGNEFVNFRNLLLRPSSLAGEAAIIGAITIPFNPLFTIGGLPKTKAVAMT